MNNSRNRLRRDKLYGRGITEVINALRGFLGLPVTDQVRQQMARKTYPLVSGTRRLVTGIAYQDYQGTVKTDPVSRVELSRFTPDLWQNSVDKSIGEFEHVTVTVTEEIGMSSDYWARDAEWGERYQLAKADSRVSRIARVDFEPPTCPFCTLMNSRGPVYVDTDSFLRTLHTGDTCEAIFVLQGQTEYPGIEHTAQARDHYEKAVKSLNGEPATANSVMDALKKAHPYEGPGKVRKAVSTAAQSSRDQRVSELSKTTDSLEKLQLKHASALRDETVSRNKEILSVLEGR